MVQTDVTEVIGTMDDGTDRTTGREGQLADAVASMRVGGVHGPETRLLVVGAVMMFAGLALVVAGWWGVSGTLEVGRQMPYLVSGGLAGIAVAVIGAALYLRFSLARHLRYWLIRLVHEQREQNEASLEEQRLQGDRVVEALGKIEALLSDRPS